MSYGSGAAPCGRKPVPSSGWSGRVEVGRRGRRAGRAPAHSEALRSKSFGNSYDSGDWFNEWDPSLTTNGIGKGLPPSADNKAFWPSEEPLLADPTLEPGHTDLLGAEAQSETLMKIRQTSPLLHLGSAALIQQKLSFPHSGSAATPGVIVERIDDTTGPDVDKKLRGLIIVFNATPTATTQSVITAQQTVLLPDLRQRHGLLRDAGPHRCDACQ